MLALSLYLGRRCLARFGNSRRVAVRRIRPADFALCQDFFCGYEGYSALLHEFIKRAYWQRPGNFHVLVAIDEVHDELAGYAAWKLDATIRVEDLRMEWVILLHRFALAQSFQGRREGKDRLSDRLYAAVERDMLERSAEVLPLNVFASVDRRNERARAFILRQRFRDAGPLPEDNQYELFVRRLVSPGPTVV